MIRKELDSAWTDDELDMLDLIGKDPIRLDDDFCPIRTDDDVVEWSTDEKKDVFDCDDVIAYIED